MANYDKVSKKMLVKEPFYALLLLNLHKEFTEDDNVCSTAGVCRYGIGYKIIINTKWYDGLTDEEGAAVLQHELQHIFLQHVTNTMGFTNHEIANYVEDLEINQQLENLPEDVITYESAKTQFPGIKEKDGSLNYYKYVIANLPPDGQNGDGGGRGQGFGTGLPGDGGKNQGSHEGWKEFDDLPTAEKELINEAADGILKSVAEQVEKSRGTIPGCFEARIKELTEIKEAVFNWKAYFRRLIGTAEEWYRKSTRKKPSKRFEGAPGCRHKHKQKLLVAIDTSGSVSNDELLDFFSEIYHIWKAGAQIDVLEYDAAVNKVWQYKGKAPETVTGRGGTDWSTAYAYYVPRMRDYSAFVTFTDGYDTYSPDRGLRNGIFVITSQGQKNNKYPGKTVFIPGK